MPKDSGFGDVVTQLKITNRLLAIQLKSSASLNQTEMIRLLSTTGAGAKEIAEVLDTTEATVRATMHRLSKRVVRREKGGSDES